MSGSPHGSAGVLSVALAVALSQIRCISRRPFSSPFSRAQSFVSGCAPSAAAMSSKFHPAAFSEAPSPIAAALRLAYSFILPSTRPIRGLLAPAASRRANMPSLSSPACMFLPGGFLSAPPPIPLNAGPASRISQSSLSTDTVSMVSGVPERWSFVTAK